MHSAWTSCVAMTKLTYAQIGAGISAQHDAGPRAFDALRLRRHLDAVSAPATPGAGGLLPHRGVRRRVGCALTYHQKLTSGSLDECIVLLNVLVHATFCVAWHTLPTARTRGYMGDTSGTIEPCVLGT